MNRTKVLIVDDNLVIRRGLKSLLEEDSSIVIAGEASTGTEAIEWIDKSLADVVLMDLGLPGMSGLEAIKKLSGESPDLAVMVLTVFKEKEKVLEALDSGAAGYLLKESDGSEIIKGLHEVFMGGSALSPAVAKIVVDELRKPSPAEEFNLSSREIEVLERLAEGL